MHIIENAHTDNERFTLVKSIQNTIEAVDAYLREQNSPVNSSFPPLLSPS